MIVGTPLRRGEPQPVFARERARTRRADSAFDGIVLTSGARSSPRTPARLAGGYSFRFSGRLIRVGILGRSAATVVRSP